MLSERLSDRYEVIAELGRGGMGVVYRARDPLLNREVAVKVVSPALLTPETEARFQSEAQLVAQMDHPSIVSIYDFGRHQGSLFFVMPIVVGDNLRVLLRKRALTLGAVVDVGIGVAEALEYSHSHGVVHRDIKPENIMVTVEAGGEVRLRIMDFGLARGNTVSGLTKSGMLLGTVSYISPEQVTTGRVDGRSDIYSLGCVLYECLVGEVPFPGEMQSVLYRVVHENPQAPRELGIQVDAELEDIVLACLAKDPARRPAKAGDLARWLRTYRTKLRESQRLQSVLLTATISAPRPVLAPFTGREAELHELQQRLNAALRGECQFVAVGGDAGVGKSRLLDEIEGLAKAREIRVLHGRFVEQHGAFPYIGFCEVIQEFFRQKESGSSSSGPLDLSDLADELIALFPMVGEIEAIRTAARSASSGAAAETHSAEGRTEVFELLARTLTRLAAGRPLVMLFEDLHGAEASLEALQYIVRRLGPTPTLIVGTYRTTEIDRRHPITQMLESFHGDRRFASLTLGPLTPSEHRKFLSTLTGGSEVADDLARKLYEATEGNPFFTKELVRSLLDSGGMTQDVTGSWLLSGGGAISSDSLPATIQQAVEARIGRLADELRNVLAVASVLGKSFAYEDLESLAEGDGERVGNLDDSVDRLIREGLLEEDRQSRGDRLAFASAVVREVLYASLARRRRRTLHRKFAERLEKRNTGRLERVYPQLLYHYSEGDVPEKTVEYGLLHARRSLESFSPEEAIRAAKTVAEFLDEGWEGDRSLEAQARMLLAAGQRMTGDLAASLKETMAAIKVFEQVGQRGEAVRALLAAARITWQARQTEETRRWVDRGLEMARSVGDNDSLAQLLSLGATLANLRGEYARGNEYLREAERLEGPREKGSADEVPRGGRLVVPLAGRIKAHAPVDLQLTEEFEVFANVFETLLGTDEEGNLHPGLAESWEMRDEGREFRFALRPDVRFSDGRPLTGQVVKVGFAQAIRSARFDLPPGFASIQGSVALAAGEAQELPGIVVTDDRTLEIHLAEPLPIYPTLLADRRTAIAQPPEGAREGAALVGTGPFVIAAHDEQRVVLERNAVYWKGAAAHLDAIEFRCGLTAAAIAAGFRAGDYDLARDLLPQDLDEVLRNPRLHAGLLEAPQKFTYFALFNCRTGPLAGNAGLRRALAGLVRARDLVWRTGGRFAAPAAGLIPPGILGHDPGLRTRPFAIEEAQRLVRAAGAEGLTLRVSVHPLVRERYQALLDGLFGAWAEVGVRAEVVPGGMEEFLRTWPENDGVDVLIARWKPDIDDPDGCTHTLFHSTVGLFRAYFTTPDVDHMLEAARRESRPGARETLYRRFESLLAEDAVLAPLFHDISYRIVNPRVHGASLSSIHPYVNYSQLGKAETPVAVSAALPIARGTIHVPIGLRVTNLDPAIGGVVEEAEIHAPIYETLLRDSGEARIEPWLAAAYRIEEGGRVYRFRLRNDVTFHDGRRLTVRDVRYSIERLLQSTESEYRFVCAPILGAQAMIDGTSTDLSGFRIHSASEFSIELERPVAFFAGLLSHVNVAIVPEGTTGIGAGPGEGAVGTGPYRIVRFEPGVRLELERNPTYWRRGLPKSERLVFHFGVPPGEILAGLRSGRFSLAGDLFPADVEALRRDATFAAGYRETPRLSTYLATFNIHTGPLSDPELRRQLVAAVDVPHIVRQTLGSLAVPAQGVIPPGLLGHDPLKRAAEARSGGTPRPQIADVELRAAVHPIFTSGYAGCAGALLKAFHDVGVKIRPVTQTMDQFLAAVRDGTADLTVGRWIADYPDADTFAYILHSTSGFLGRYCGTPEIDRLLAQGRSETDPDARHTIYRRIEEIIARDALLLPLFHEQSYRFARPDVEGLTVSAFMPTVAYELLTVRPD